MTEMWMNERMDKRINTKWKVEQKNEQRSEWMEKSFNTHRKHSTLTALLRTQTESPSKFRTVQFIVLSWLLWALVTQVDTGSHNGWLPDIKPLPEPMLTLVFEIFTRNISTTFQDPSKEFYFSHDIYIYIYIYPLATVGPRNKFVID